jgi:adenylyltransferase/sulfurtransferase
VGLQATIIGAGRTGSRIAAALAKTSLTLTIIDRDCLEESDLTDSPVYGRADLGKMKAEALAKHVGAYGTPICEHLCAQNIDELLEGTRIVLDATDNWHARALVNEWCWKTKTPWIYSGALAAKAMASAITPPQKPCWLCWNAIEPTQVLSCSTSGIDGRAADAAAQKAVEQAQAIAQEKRPELAGKLFFADVGKKVETQTPLVANPECPVCAKGKLPLLNGTETAQLVCGSGQWLFLNVGLKEKVRHYTVQALAAKLGRGATAIESVVQITREKASAIVFPGGRATIRAKDEPAARKLNDEIAERLSA